MRPPLHFVVGFLTLAFSASLSAQAPAAIRYDISFPNRVHHEAEITVVYPKLDPGMLALRMSRTSPGRYALHEFAKNVYNVRVTGVDGRVVTVRRPNLSEWDVSGHGGEVTVRYTLYGDRAGGTYTGIDRTHAHLNMPATFMWAPALQDRPMRLTVHVPEESGWKVATQLVPTDDPYTFTARDLSYWMDSPTEVSDFRLLSWKATGPNGRPETMHIALHAAATKAQAEELEQKTRAIVQTEARIFGTLAPYDYGTYTFLSCDLPWVASDGMEHRNSTSLTRTSSLADDMVGLLGTVAHEFFHSWNMERIRSKELEPFDFEHADMSGELWFGEGFTNYYGHLALWRAGIIDDAQFARMEGAAVGSVMDAPGKRFFTPVEMSEQAPYVDAAVSIDPTNQTNTFISYYTWGEVIALGLDLTLRSRYPGVTLDDLMREMWRTHGSPEIPYDNRDIEAALARVTKDAALAGDFFDRYVYGHDVQDFGPLLAAAGFKLVRAREARPTLGVTVRSAPGGEGLLVVRGTRIGTPAYEAGLDLGDVLLAVDGHQFSSIQDIASALSGRVPGDSVRLRYESRGETRQAPARLREDPARVAVPVEAAGGTLSDSQRRFRAEWKRGAEGPSR